MINTANTTIKMNGTQRNISDCRNNAAGLLFRYAALCPNIGLGERRASVRLNITDSVFKRNRFPIYFQDAVQSMTHTDNPMFTLHG